MKHMLLLCVFALLIFSTQLTSLNAYNFSSESNTQAINLFLIVFLILFLTPIMKFVYIKFLQKYVDKTMAEIEKVRKRISDRLSDAGRKLSETMKQ